MKQTIYTKPFRIPDDIPSGNIVDEVYVLTESDLPDMSEYCPEGYVFNGWEMNYPGSGNIALAGMSV